MTIEEIQAEASYGNRFQVEGYGGIAFYLHKLETVPDEDTEWSGIENPTGMVIMVMVGDDREHVVDPEDIEVIPEGSYCPECGQIGCTAGQL